MLNRTLPKYKVKLFPPGKKFIVNDKIHTVENVCIRGYTLMVKFKELDYSIDADTIDCEYEEIDFNNTIKE